MSLLKWLPDQDAPHYFGLNRAPYKLKRRIRRGLRDLFWRALARCWWMR